MWFSFWRSRDRFTVDELRYLTEQLQKVQVVNEINKGFVIEALRSIAELVTYGDQHDSSFFEFFMEKQIMGEFTRILRVSKVMDVSVQLLQTMSIMIQNLRSEHAIYYLFSNEHINSLITYSFDFQNEELLSYYISFLRATSGKLNRNTISLLVKTKNEEVTSFPLYTEAVRFAFHEEKMVRIAVRTLTLNVYHVGDENVNKYVSSAPLSDYFSNLIKHFQKQCIDLDQCVSNAFKNPQLPDSASSVITGVDEIEDSLYYFSDMISAGIPELGRLITENILQLLILPMLLPSLMEQSNGSQIRVTTSLYLLCCILHIAKTKELASTIATALLCALDCFLPESEAKLNGSVLDRFVANEKGQQDDNSFSLQVVKNNLEVCKLKSSSSPDGLLQSCSCSLCSHGSQPSLREILLSYVVSGNEIQALGSLTLLATLLQTKELDESMLDGLGILPQRKQHKKRLLTPDDHLVPWEFSQPSYPGIGLPSWTPSYWQALVGEGSGEEQLFSPENSLTKDSINSELDRYIQRFKALNGFSFCCGESGVSPQVHRYQVLNALVSLFSRPNISASVLWAGGWLLRQLLPHGETEFSSQHLKQLKESHKYSTALLYEETKGGWCDQLLTVLLDEWKSCKKAIEASSPQKDLKCILLPLHRNNLEGESSFAAAGRMLEKLQVFVLQHQLLILCCGGLLADLVLVNSPPITPANSRAKVAGFDVLVPKPGTEILIADAIPCRIAFERGKERHFSFLAISKGISGWVLLVDELPLKPQYGVVRVAAPLAGSNPKIDDKHQKWLHLRIRPSTFPWLDASVKGKPKVVVDGRWVLAFRDEQACKSADSMILEEMHLQSSEVENRVKSLLNLE